MNLCGKGALNPDFAVRLLRMIKRHGKQSFLNAIAKDENHKATVMRYSKYLIGD